jgi:hypothetical protein
MQEKGLKLVRNQTFELGSELRSLRELLRICVAEIAFSRSQGAPWLASRGAMIKQARHYKVNLTFLATLENICNWRVLPCADSFPVLPATSAG